MIDRKLALGAAIALGGVLLIPGVATALGRAAKPFMRAAARTGARAYDEMRAAGVEAYEHFEDAMAEAKAQAAKAGDAAEDVTDEVARAFEESQTGETTH